MPLAPNCPKLPVLGGMNGCQCAGSTDHAPIAMKLSTTASLTATMALFSPADSRVPSTSSAVSASTIAAAGRLAMAPAAVPGAAIRDGGRLTPTLCSTLTA